MITDGKAGCYIMRFLSGIVCLCLAAGHLAAGMAEYEINLVRNPEFLPGLDRQGPRDWIYYATTNLLDAGRGFARFSSEGMTITGAAALVQLEMCNDISPGYRLAGRVKAENGQCTFTMRMGGAHSHMVATSRPGAWEDIELLVAGTNHFGFNIKIAIPPGVRLTLKNLRVTPVLPPAADMSGTVCWDAGGSVSRIRGIRLPADPNWAEQLAAHEVRVNIYLASGAVLPVFAGAEGHTDGAGYINIVNLRQPLPAAPASRPGEFRAPDKMPCANGYRLVTGAGGVDVIGGNDAGVLAGAMQLSEQLGVKFYAPRVFTVVRNPDLTISALDITRHPAFEWADGSGVQTRNPWKYGYLYSESSVADSAKASPPGSGGWVHPPVFLAPPFLYARRHPEFYAMVKGRRIDGFADKAGYINLCLANPELHQVIAGRIAMLMEAYPQAKYFSIGQGDGMSWCECEKCRALDADPAVLTDRLVAYANAVAENLEMPAKYPDRRLLVMAYAAQREDIPLREKPHPNVAVQYALWKSSWPIWGDTFCRQNRRGLALLDAWNAFTGTNLTLFLYPVNTYENAEKIKLAADKGLRGFYHCGWRGDFPETTIYTTGRLIWDPAADVEALIDEIMPVMYGGAAPPMRDYFTRAHAFLKQAIAAPALWNRYYDSSLAMPWLMRAPAEYAEPALALLRRAEEAAREDNNHMLPMIRAERLKLLLAWMNLEAAHADSLDRDQFEAHAGRMAELVALARALRAEKAFRTLSFPDWLFEASAGALDIERDPRKWPVDPRVDEFLAAPAETLARKKYLQQPVEGGWELPASAWVGGRYYANYAGYPGVVLRRQSSPESRVRAYFRLDQALGGSQLRLQGLDNDKKEKAEIKITINGNSIFNGPVEFAKNKWGWLTFEAPQAFLKAGENLLVIQNTTGDNQHMPAGAAGPADDALAQDYNWGWCIIGQARIVDGAGADAGVARILDVFAKAGVFHLPEDLRKFQGGLFAAFEVLAHPYKAIYARKAVTILPQYEALRDQCH